MRGLQHNVIEIKDTENTNIDKILVFLKPHRQQIDVKTTRKEAQEILQKVKSVQVSGHGSILTATELSPIPNGRATFVSMM